MLGKLSRWKRVGLLAAGISAGAMFLNPTTVFAAERGHDRDRGAPVQHFDRGRDFAHGNIRVGRDFDRHDRSWTGRAFVGGVVVSPVPGYVPVPQYVPAPYAYQNVPAPVYNTPAPGCNTAPYAY